VGAHIDAGKSNSSWVFFFYTGKSRKLVRLLDSCCGLDEGSGAKERVLQLHPAF
jgi:hypothetical protein